MVRASCRVTLPVSRTSRFGLSFATFRNPAVKMLFLVEFAPLVLFFAGYLYKGIYFAIVILMITMPISLTIKYRVTGKIDKILVWSTVFLFLFGGVSIYLQDPLFIYWKPTAFYWAMALAFLASQWIGDKPLVQRFFGLLGDLPMDHMSPQRIRLLNLVWVAFFALAGLLNVVVAYNFSEEFWVNFKVFGLTALSIVFMFTQIYWILSTANPESESTESPEP